MLNNSMSKGKRLSSVDRVVITDIVVEHVSKGCSLCIIISTSMTNKLVCV